MVLWFHSRLQVQAVNQGSISLQTATAFVNITVIRNENPPVFTRDQYSQVIQDTSPVGSSIVQVTANDLDGDVVRYSVIDGAEDMDFFYLNPSTGLFTLSRYIYQVGQDSYRFTVQASDQRVNFRTDTADVFIQVQRDQSAPQFQQEPYSGSVREIDVNGTIIDQTTCFDPDLRGRIVYQTVGFTVAAAFFSINPSNGNVFLYDRDALRQHPSTFYTVSTVTSQIFSANRLLHFAQKARTLYMYSRIFIVTNF